MAVFQVDRRAREAHSLSTRGEAAAQKRAAEVHETFLESSKETLELVNATLLLAKEANERAANIIQRKAVELLNTLDGKAKLLITDPGNDDDRALVSKPELRSELRSLAQKINSFETNRFIFPEELPLTPHCLFIRGLDFHLEQQFTDAFECWDGVQLSDASPADLRGLALYWIAYERNNLGHFDAAEANFKRAEEYATGLRKFELQRIRIESRFFNTERGPAENSIRPLEDLLVTLSDEPETDELQKRRARITTTLGNVLAEAGREATLKAEHDTAQKYYERAREKYAKAVELEKWARFGLGEVLSYLGEIDKGEELLRTQVRQDALSEDVDRIEPRTKVLARTTELMCCVLVSELRKEAPSVCGKVVDALGTVDNRMTVYSQIRKRNVMKGEFKKDLNWFLTRHELENIII